MLVDSIQYILENAREELGRIEDIKADVEERISELNDLESRASEMEARATDAITTLEELSYALGEVEVLADDAINLGIY